MSILIWVIKPFISGLRDIIDMYIFTPPLHHGQDVTQGQSLNGV